MNGYYVVLLVQGFDETDVVLLPVEVVCASAFGGVGVFVDANNYVY